MRRAASITIDLYHDYYASGRCEQLEIEPTAVTDRLLQKYGLLWRAEPGQAIIYGPVDEESSSLLQLPASGLELLFYLRWQEQYIVPFTALPDLPEALDDTINPALVFTNEADNPAIAQLNPGWETGSPAGYKDQLFGYLRIRLQSAQLSTLPYALRLDLQSTTEIWKYYLIDDPLSSEAELLWDNEAEPVVFEKYDTSTAEFSSLPLSAKLQRQYPDARIMLYQSDQAITWQEQRYPYVQLHRQGRVVLPTVPNPSWKNQGVHIINALSIS